MAQRKRLPQNFIPESQTIGSWTITRATVSSNADTAPDGSVTADRLVDDNTVTNTHFATKASLGFSTTKVGTFTLYIKAGTLSWIAVTDNLTITTYANATTGALGTVIANTSTMTSVGNGWYRLTMTGTFENNQIIIYLATADGTVVYSGTGTGYVSLWGAQFEQANAHGDYIATTTSTINPTIAPQNRRLPTNRFNRSNDYNNWVKTNVTTGNLDATGPSGVANTATTVTDSSDGGASSHYLDCNATGVTFPSFQVGSVWTMWVDAKKGTKDKIALTPAGAAFQVTYDLTNGVVGQTLNQLPVIARCQALGGGWYRCSMTFQVTATHLGSTNADNRIWILNSLSSLTYQGNGTGTIILGDSGFVQSDDVPDLIRTGSAIIASPTGTPRLRAGQNFYIGSEDVQNGNWTTVNATALRAAGVAPNGTSTAGRVTDTVTNATHSISQAGLPAIPGKVYTKSAWIKYESQRYIILAGNGGDSTAYVYWDAVNNVATPVGANVISYGSKSYGDGWYRVWNTFLANTNATGPVFYFADSVGVLSYAGTGSKSLLLWGMQHEQSNSLGDYTPTVTPYYQNVALGTYNPSGAPQNKRTV